MIKLLVNEEKIIIEGSKNYLIIDGSYRHGRDFEVIDVKENIDYSEFKEILLKQGGCYQLNSCYHTDGETIEKVCWKGDTLVFFSEVDECCLSHYETRTYIAAGYDILKKEFYDYWECSDSLSKELELIVESIQAA